MKEREVFLQTTSEVFHQMKKIERNEFSGQREEMMKVSEVCRVDLAEACRMSPWLGTGSLWVGEGGGS